MTSLALPSTGAWKSALVGTFRCLATSARLALKTFVAAPLIVAISVVPEAAQHVVEVKLGMFESKEAFRSLADDPTRWAFGYAKIAGLVAAMLLTARFWATGSARRAILLTPVELGRLLVAIALLLGLGEGLMRLGDWSGSAIVSGMLLTLNWIVQSLLLVVVAGALLGDADGWRRNLLRRLPTALLMTLLSAALFLPLQGVHMANHLLAIGRPEWLVWPVLLFDSLVVGLMATAIGATLFVAYQAGPTWRGWTRDPRLQR